MDKTTSGTTRLHVGTTNDLVMLSLELEGCDLHVRLDPFTALDLAAMLTRSARRFGAGPGPGDEPGPQDDPNVMVYGMPAVFLGPWRRPDGLMSKPRYVNRSQVEPGLSTVMLANGTTVLVANDEIRVLR